MLEACQVGLGLFLLPVLLFLVPLAVCFGEIDQLLADPGGGDPHGAFRQSSDNQAKRANSFAFETWFLGRLVVVLRFLVTHCCASLVGSPNGVAGSRWATLPYFRRTLSARRLRHVTPGASPCRLALPREGRSTQV